MLCEHISLYDKIPLPEKDSCESTRFCESTEQLIQSNCTEEIKYIRRPPDKLIIELFCM